MKRHAHPPLLATSALRVGLVLMLTGCPDDGGIGSTSATEGEDTTSDAGTDSGVGEDGYTTGDLPTSTGTSMTTGEDSTSTTTGDLTTTTDDSTTTEDTGDTSGTSAASSSTTGDGPAICGDGLIGGDEECDAGELNGVEGSQCSADCTIPSCGDGHFDPEEEECDGSDPMFVEVAVCTNACTWDGVIAFVTNETFQGDLGGLTGADARCRTAAKNAGLTSPDGYRAWLGISPEDAASRIPQVDRPYYRLDGEKIAENAADLLDGKLLASIAVTELKGTLMFAPVWTNSSGDGSVASLTEDCQSFSSSSENEAGGVGLSGKTDETWTNFGPSTCDRYRRLYCFSEAF
ncbi:MAG: hypothetical protein R3A79_22600 [Nannocystaceae bacterium]